MSRIGKKIIEIPQEVKVEISGKHLKASGPRGMLEIEVHPHITAQVVDGKISVAPSRKELDNKARGLWGLYRALIANVVTGVSRGFEKKLEIEGIGYKAAVVGDELVLNVGFINPVKIKKPAGIEFAVEKGLITVSGINKEMVGQVAAEIRASKKAEPYKGKGIKYQGEVIRRKEGKKVVASK